MELSYTVNPLIVSDLHVIICLCHMTKMAAMNNHKIVAGILSFKVNLMKVMVNLK